MPRQNPLTRLQAVASGLRQLADSLDESGVDPINLRYWASELEDIQAKLEGVGVVAGAEGEATHVEAD